MLRQSWWEGRAVKYNARRKARSEAKKFRKGRFTRQEVAVAFDVPFYIIQYMTRWKKIPFEKIGHRVWLNSESITAILKRGLNLKI